MKGLVFIFAFAIVFVVGVQNVWGEGVDCYWANPVNGIFDIGTFWTPVGTPGSPDRAIFNQPGLYTVGFAAEYVNDRLLVDAGNVTLNLDGYTYSLEREWDNILGQSVMIAQSPASTGKLTVAGGNVFAKDCKIGVAADSVGELVIDAGAEWSALQHAVVIGDTGHGSLTVQNGGYLLHGHGWAGGQPNTSEGTITVTGADSKWTVTGWFGLGQIGTGQV